MADLAVANRRANTAGAELEALALEVPSRLGLHRPDPKRPSVPRSVVALMEGLKAERLVLGHDSLVEGLWYDPITAIVFHLEVVGTLDPSSRRPGLERPDSVLKVVGRFYETAGVAHRMGVAAPVAMLVTSHLPNPGGDPACRLWRLAQSQALTVVVVNRTGALNIVGVRGLTALAGLDDAPTV